MTATTTKPRLKYDRTVGIVAMEGRGFSNPVDLAVSSDSRLYVLSRTNTLQTFGIRIGICTLEGEYFGHFGEFGDADGAFVWPTALAFDSQDRLYLADEYNHRITVFDTEGEFLNKWGAQGVANGELNGPAGLAIDDDGNVYVSDHLNHRIQCFAPDGRYLRKWGNHGNGDGEFDLPWGLTVAGGHVYVADWRNDRIQKFTLEGDLVAKYGGSGDGDGQFHRPASVAVDTDGFIYVADWGNERVQVLGPDGSFVQKLRGEADLSKWAEEFYEANDDEKLQRDMFKLVPEMSSEVETPYEESARTEPYFWGPISVKLDREGRLYVTESNRHRVQVYSRT
jgi:DNA-binding beta-propeller fold protein YncE